MLGELLELLHRLARGIDDLQASLPGGLGNQAGDILRDLTKLLQDMIGTMADFRELCQQLLDLLEAIRWGANALLDLFLHFCYSAPAGLLAFLATRSVTRSLLERLIFRSLSKDLWEEQLEPDISRLAWSSLFFVSWLVHCWWDGLIF